MTCIVGYAYEGGVTIAGDSAGVSGLELRIRRDEKVFKNQSFVFGCTTSFRMIQLLRYKLQPPKRHAEQDVMEFMATVFVDAVRNTFKDGGFASKSNEFETGGHFLVGHAGRLFSIYSDYQVAENADGFDACGCGESYALGALHMARNEEMSVPQRLICALDCAAHFSAGVQGPYIYLQGGAL